MKRAVLVSLVALTLGCNQVTLHDLIRLPDNFPAEGMAIGNGATFYVGSFGAAQGTAGQILVGDLTTGLYSELVPPDGVPMTGMKFDSRSNLLFVCRGPSGSASVFDVSSKTEVRSYQFNDPATSFVNDVVLTADAAYFTDSHAAQLYRVALGSGAAPASEFTTIPLPADFAWPDGSGAYNPFINANGLAATANGEFLIPVHTGKGTLYRLRLSDLQVDPITISGGDGTGAGNGDGLLLEDKTLYVVKNRNNMVAVFEMSADYLSANITRYIKEPFFHNSSLKVPTAIASIGDSLYVSTAALTNEPPFVVVRMAKN
jgi:sugar lactone lactonase YvrE